ncbi:MAG: hypothetical protein GTO00_05465, partial [Deltaproteobacteria bacterium]|nr:hypothetical protein [Deltaproteobacteria bacterium]
MRIFPPHRVAVLSCIVILLFSCGGGGGGSGSISITLELPRGVDPSILSPDDRIVVRISGPDFPGITREFSRSVARGTIGDVPEGNDRVIKVDEYDSGGDLIARGFAYGLQLRDGEDTSVPVVMVPKGWVVTIAGGKGPGDSPDGTYARDALLNGP